MSTSLDPTENPCSTAMADQSGAASHNAGHAAIKHPLLPKTSNASHASRMRVTALMIRVILAIHAPLEIRGRNAIHTNSPLSEPKAHKRHLPHGAILMRRTTWTIPHAGKHRLASLTKDLLTQ